MDPLLHLGTWLAACLCCLLTMSVVDAIWPYYQSSWAELAKVVLGLAAIVFQWVAFYVEFKMSFHWVGMLFFAATLILVYVVVILGEWLGEKIKNYQPKRIWPLTLST